MWKIKEIVQHVLKMQSIFLLPIYSGVCYNERGGIFFLLLLFFLLFFLFLFFFQWGWLYPA
jgi:hypothetical protein